MTDLQSHYSRSTRRAMRAMAQSLSIDADKFDLTSVEGMQALWQKITEAIGTGVQRTAEPVVGDPFAVFVTAICTEPHDGRGNHEQTAVVKTGAMVDQTEGQNIIDYLKAQDNVNTCEICGKKITTWSVDNTRVSTFAAKDRAKLATTVRGSD